MSGDGNTAPRGAGDHAPQGQMPVTPDTGVARHTCNLRPKRRTTHAVPPQVATVLSVVAPGEGEANLRRVGGHDVQAETDVDESGSGSEVSDEDPSDDQSERYALRSEASDDWVESRSRITTPESSTPSTPRRRTSVEELASRRPSESTWCAPPGA